MALSDDRIAEMMRDTWGCASIAPRHALEFARAIESEVRKQDTELIRQLVEALDEATTYTASAMWSPSMTNECKELVAKGRARLEVSPKTQGRPHEQLYHLPHANQACAQP